MAKCKEDPKQKKVKKVVAKKQKPQKVQKPSKSKPAKFQPYDAIILPDKYWWINSATKQLVKHSRHEDPAFSEDFGGQYAYPAVCEIWRTPKGGTTNYRMPLPWWNCLWANNSQRASDFIRRINAGLFNRVNYDQWPDRWPIQTWIPEDLSKWTGEMPVAEGMASVGARVRVTAHVNGSAKILTYKTKQKPPKKFAANMSHKFSAINPDGTISKVGGTDIFLPYVTQQGFGYIPLNRLRKIG
jgi:hypothetical protein